MEEKTWIKLMEFGHYMGCHQIAERSFFIKGCQMPVCARCTGLYIGQFIALILIIAKKNIPTWSVFLLMAVMGIDWTVQALEIKKSTNIRRLITGICGGISALFIYYNSFRFLKNFFKKHLTNHAV